MKHAIAFSLVSAAALVTPWASAADVGVSIGINQPGVSGRIDIGRFPQPALVSMQPVVIQSTPITVHRQPIYLYVPPGHQQQWGSYCHRYQACGQPVYFVQENWVRERYQHEHPRWRDQHGRGHNDHDRGDRRDDRRNDRRDDRRDDRHGDRR